MVGDDQAVDALGLVVLRRLLVAVKAVGGLDRAVDDRAGQRVGQVVGELPAQDVGAELLGAAVDGGRDRPRAADVELVAVAEPGDDEALAGGVGHGQVFELALGLAGLEQRLERAVVGVVADVLAVEHADGDRVGVRVEGCGGR